jgi:hypothetical protein
MMIPTRARTDSPITTFGVMPAPKPDHWLIRERMLCPVCDQDFVGTPITMVLVGFHPEDRESGKTWANGGTVVVHAACAGVEQDPEPQESM